MIEKSSYVNLTEHDIFSCGNNEVSTRVKTVYPDITLEVLKQIVDLKQYFLITNERK